MERSWIAAAAVAAILGCGFTSADAGVLVPVPPVSDGSATYITAINNHNVIAGFYTSTVDGREHGFVGGLDGSYTTFVDVYGGAVVEGLNDDGYIVGHSDGETNDCYLSGYGCQFLRKPDGTIREITKDKAPLDGMPGQINNRREFVGLYAYTDGRVTHEPDYFGKNAKYVRDLTVGGRPRGLSKSGVITGWAFDDAGGEGGFIWNAGVETVYEYPDADAFNTIFNKLNGHGLVAGEWLDQNETYSRAFLFDSRKARFKAIDTPGGTYAYAEGVNNAGIAAVSVDDTSYIYCPHKKTCPITAGAIEVPDRWISARPAKVARVCERDCVDKPGRSKPLGKLELARVRAAEERERRLPFRP